MKIVKKIYPNFRYEYIQYIHRGTISVEISKEIMINSCLMSA